MKKITALILTLIIAISTAACGGTPQAAGGNQNPTDTVQTGDIGQTALLSGEAAGEITVSCYDTMEYQAYLEGAAKLFEEMYPGTKVNVETFSAMPEIKTSEQPGGGSMTAVMVQDDPQGRTDYVSKVSTSLMSGSGADIFAMDVLPVHKYAESGQLENLDAYMDADDSFNRSDYRENILDAVKYQGGTWFIPLDYTFDYYAYDSTLIQDSAAAGFGDGGAFTAGQLVDIAKPLFDGSSKMFNAPDYMRGPGAGIFSMLLDENYKSFVDLENKKANFNDGSFEALLNTVKDYSKLGYVPEGVTGRMDAGAMMRDSREAPTERYFYKTKNVFSLTQQFNRNSNRRMNIMSSGTPAGIEDDDEIAGMCADENGNVLVEYQQAYGINANSQNKRTAWEFIKFLLSEEMQLSTNSSPMAVPVLNSAREKKAEMILSGAFMGRGEPLDDQQREVLDKYMEAEEKLAKQINSYTMKDTIIDDMIASEAAYFFDGSKTAGEVASVLQSKVALYLNE